MMYKIQSYTWVDEVVIHTRSIFVEDDFMIKCSCILKPGMDTEVSQIDSIRPWILLNGIVVGSAVPSNGKAT